MDLQRRMLAHEDAGSAGVIEMDVREEEVAQVLELEAALVQRIMQVRDARRRTAVVERRTVLGLEDVRRDDALCILEVEIERIWAHRARILSHASDRGGGPAPSSQQDQRACRESDARAGTRRDADLALGTGSIRGRARGPAGPYEPASQLGRAP